MQGSPSLLLPLFVHGRGPRATPFPEFALYLIFNVRPGRPATAGTQTSIDTIPRCLPLVNRSPRKKLFSVNFPLAHMCSRCPLLLTYCYQSTQGSHLTAGRHIDNCSTGPAGLGGDVLANHISNTGLRILASSFSLSHGASHYQQSMKLLCYPYAGYLYGGRSA